ncbi:MAG: hypothetical protein NUV32_02440 [Exilispira sp.]|jgi:regulatory protein YycI of two-component signal transduction system YycFG|nr:hypothetical protein [Exilispira sp.]
MENFEDIKFIDLSKNLKNKGCLIDSSSIIYLDRINLLSVIVQNYKIKTIDLIKLEVLSNIDKQLNEIELLNNIEIVNKITDDNLNNFLPSNFTDSTTNQFSKISMTDRYLIYSSFFYGFPILTDDGVISKICNHRKHPYYNSLIAILLLLYDDLITVENAIDSFYKINKFGRYSDKIFSFAFNILERIIKSKNI